jgi:S-DNA-T family DNA segregation ATPase FtsK/SpoIIIE
MDRRYKRLEESGSRNLFSYNVNHPEEAMPFIVIVVDELADLMAKHAREVEGPVVRLSQLARAVGIHLVLATQRPSVNVITGLIKANIPSRVAFKVASQVDSRTILDMGGAEKLVGTGDMLFLASDNTKPRRLQGGFVSEDEVREVVKFIVDNNDTEDFVADDTITDDEKLGGSGLSGGGEADDPLFEEAKRVAREAGKLSASLLQRRLRVGYARAARILDMLEAAGVIGPQEGNKPREVLLTEAEEEAMNVEVKESAKDEPAEIAELEITEEDDATEDDGGKRPW